MPADRARAHAGKHRPLLSCSDQHLIDPQPPPHRHHAKRIAAADIDEVRRPDPPARGSPVPGSPVQQKIVGSAPEEIAIDAVEGLAVLFIVAACRRDEERAWGLPTGEIYDGAIDGKRL